MRVALAVLTLGFVAVKSMPSLNFGGHELGQGYDSLPTGTNGQDNTKSDFNIEKDGVQMTQTQTKHTEEKNETEEYKENASEHTEKYGDTTHSVADTDASHKKHSDEASHDETETKTVGLNSAGLVASEDQTTVDEEKQADEESGRRTHKESDTSTNSNHTLESGSQYSKSNATTDKQTKHTHKDLFFGADGSTDYKKDESSTDEHDERKKASGSFFRKEEESTKDGDHSTKKRSFAGSRYKKQEAKSSRNATQSTEQSHSDGEDPPTNGRKHRVQDGFNRYLDNDEKKLGLNTDSQKSAEVLSSSPIARLRHDYLVALAQRIHNTKIVGTADGGARIVSKSHSAEHDKKSKYRTLAQKFGYSPVSSHYANAQFVQSRYRNLPHYVPKYGKLQYGAGSTQLGAGKFWHGTGKTQYEQNGASFAGKTRHYIANLQLSPEEWEERARKNAEIQNAKYNTERGLSGQNSGFYRRKLHKLNPLVRDVIFSQNLEDFLRTQESTRRSTPAFKLFGFNGFNTKIVRPQTNNSRNNSDTGTVTSPNNDREVEGRSTINIANNTSWPRRYAIKNRRKKVKIFIKTDKANTSSNATSNTFSKSGRLDENTVRNNWTYGNSENSYVEAKTRSDNVDSEGLSGSRVNSTHVGQGNVGDQRDPNGSDKDLNGKEGSIDSADASAKSNSSRTTVVDSTTGYENSETTTAKIPNNTSGSTDSNSEADSEFKTKHVKGNIVGSPKYKNYDDYNESAKDKNGKIHPRNSNKVANIKVAVVDSTSDIGNSANNTATEGSNSIVTANSIVDSKNSTSQDIDTKNGNFSNDSNKTTNSDTVSNKTSQVEDVENRDNLTIDTDSNINNTKSVYSTDLDISNNRTSEAKEAAITTSQAIAKNSSDFYNVSKFGDFDMSIREDKNDNVNSGLNEVNAKATDSTPTESLSVNSTLSSTDELNDKTSSVANVSAANNFEAITTDKELNSPKPGEIKNSTNAGNITLDSYNSTSEPVTENGASSRNTTDKNSTVVGKPIPNEFDKISGSTPTPDAVNTTLASNNADNGLFTTLSPKYVSDSPVDNFDDSTFDTSVIGIRKPSDSSANATIIDRFDTSASARSIVSNSKSDVASAKTTESTTATTKASNDSSDVITVNSQNMNGSDTSDALTTSNTDIFSIETSTPNNLRMNTANVSSFSTDTPAYADNNVTDSTSLDSTTLSSSTYNETDLILTTEFVTATEKEVLADTTARFDSHANDSDSSAIATANTNETTLSYVDSTEGTTVEAASISSTTASAITADTTSDFDSSKPVSMSNPKRLNGTNSDGTDNAGTTNSTSLTAADSATGNTTDSNTKNSAGSNRAVDNIDITRKSQTIVQSGNKTTETEFKSDENASKSVSAERSVNAEVDSVNTEESSSIETNSR